MIAIFGGRGFHVVVHIVSLVGNVRGKDRGAPINDVLAHHPANDLGHLRAV